ncbi:hypothetical protein PHAVU_002G046300, partial [Phaseolus vulgaris]
DALSAFRGRLSDPNNVMQSWDPTLVNPCTWLRVSCDSNDNVVLRMHLFGNKLSGNIPQELGSLKNLISMDLSKNKLEGNIPKSFANLKSLKSLYNLSVIRYLGNSGLSGTLGPELAQLPSLQHLHLFGNNLSGNIPQELGSLKNLISMDLSKNKLEGNIPESFANLESLKFLWLDNNELSGTIPSAVVTLLKNLVVFFGNKKFRSARVKGVVA